LIAALRSTAVFGPRTNRDFLIDALSRPSFAAGEATTAFITETFGEAGYQPAPPEIGLYAAAAVLQHATALSHAAAEALDVSSSLHEWTSAGHLETIVEYEIDDARRTFFVRPLGGRTYAVRSGAEVVEIAIRDLDADTARFAIGGQTTDVIYRGTHQLGRVRVSQGSRRGPRRTASAHAWASFGGLRDGRRIREKGRSPGSSGGNEDAA
jgi:geranyl-CoA carboxylase alpha subunit